MSMFKISTKGDYGLLFLSTLGQKMNSGRSFISLKEIADEKKLSLPYLSQIATTLKEAGVVKSKEGRDGGYSLVKPAGKITLMEVLEVLEGPLTPVRCCGNAKAKCGSEAHCNVKSTWQQAQSMLATFLKGKTLEDTFTSSPH